MFIVAFFSILAKHPSSNIIFFSFITTYFNFEHPENAFFPTLWTFFPMISFAIFLLLRNTFFAIEVTWNVWLFNFKQIRYYGLYARSRENDKKISLAIAKKKRKIILSFNRWRDCTLSSFGYDPLKCPCCGETMLFLELYHKHQHISLNEMYERAMGRLPSPSSA